MVIYVGTRKPTKSYVTKTPLYPQVELVKSDYKSVKKVFFLFPVSALVDHPEHFCTIPNIFYC